MLTLGKRELRDYQDDGHNKTLTHFRTSRDPAVLVASVGAGKSTLIAALATMLKTAIEKANNAKNYKVLILARQPNIVKDISLELWEMETKHTTILKGKKPRLPATIICSTEGVTANALDSYYAETNLFALAIDESHMLSFDDDDTQYMKIINHFRAINHNIIICGYTGTPYRGTEHIVNGRFWKKQLTDISTKYLVGRGFLVPYVWGEHDEKLDLDFNGLSNLPDSKIGGVNDFTDSQLEEWALKPESVAKLKYIVQDALNQNRTMRLWFCSSVKHCDMVAALLPNRDQVAVITQNTGDAEREILLEKARTGEIADLINCTALTTGFNRPLIDHVIWLRACNSMVLFEQGNGRGARILKPEHVRDGFVKEDCLISDYAGCMDRLGHLFDNVMLEDLEVQKQKKKDKQPIFCPKCNTENSVYAKRCRGEDFNEVDNRCDWFFCEPVVCDKCHTKNSPNARECRSCRAIIKDPNEKLTGKAYTENDFYKCLSMRVNLTKDKKGLCFFYKVHGQQKDACEVYYPFGSRWQRGDWKKHITQCGKDLNIIKAAKNIFELHNNAMNLFNTPELVTYRINDKGKAILTHKRYGETLA
jgi:superfamily II DNA or RNA helicase